MKTKEFEPRGDAHPPMVPLLDPQILAYEEIVNSYFRLLFVSSEIEINLNGKGMICSCK